MDIYSSYNQIKMNPLDANKINFMTNNYNYYSEVMPFDLKNVGTAHQILMEVVFMNQIWQNIEIYIDNLVVKTSYEKNHCSHIEDTPSYVRKYNMCINLN